MARTEFLVCAASSRVRASRQVRETKSQPENVGTSVDVPGAQCAWQANQGERIIKRDAGERAARG
ncbi:hypothetical protein WM40_10320 [Robbsia andropogonis]|uniref:Uncharacterized protein n=1 Tax=Robbsia andropogonis TaxID=28092 RepID=A0A0F5K1G2_9BURK|nr:hypothetical protein WM40_10320 [Robbsia andropogonis]